MSTFKENTCKETKISCQFCNSDAKPGFISLNQTVDYSGIEIAMNKNGILRTRYFPEADKNFIAQDIINIKFCPICGKRINT